MSLDDGFPVRVERCDGAAAGNIEREDNEVRSQKGVVLGRRGVIEMERVRAVVEGDVEAEGLVQIVQDG